MLLISATVLFLGLYISSTTPIAVTPNAPALVVPRTIQEYNLCEPDLAWVRSECTPALQITAWRDVCEGGVQLYGSCPIATVCEAIFDGLDETTRCIPLIKEGETELRTSETDPQIGTSPKKFGIISQETTQLGYEVMIADDMAASVTAMFLGKFLQFASKLVADNII
jgi:hypothetical protein